MKRICVLLIALLAAGVLSGCGGEAAADTILATTYPMYFLTQQLTEGMEDVQVELMVADAVSCLHNYTLTTEQMKKLERADLVVMSGLGLEDFMASALESVPSDRIIVAAASEEHMLLTETGEPDPHYWLSPYRYREALATVSAALRERYPDQAQLFAENERRTAQALEALEGGLEGLACQELITFHDGFSYFAEAYGLTIAAAIEEEEGAEASAGEIKEICELIEERGIPAIFVEKNGSTNAAEIIARETGVKIYTLDMIMDGQTDYIAAMTENIRTVKEALT